MSLEQSHLIKCCHKRDPGPIRLKKEKEKDGLTGKEQSADLFPCQLQQTESDEEGEEEGMWEWRGKGLFFSPNNVFFFNNSAHQNLLS